MTATHTTNSTVFHAPVLYLALDLGTSSWKLAFSVGLGQKPGCSRVHPIDYAAFLGFLAPALP